jgi:hypothetical protein
MTPSAKAGTPNVQRFGTRGTWDTATAAAPAPVRGMSGHCPPGRRAWFPNELESVLLAGWRGCEDRSEKGAVEASNALRLCTEPPEPLCLRVIPNCRTVGFVGRQALEGEQSVRDVAGALVRQKAAVVFAAEPSDDGDPTGHVFLERFRLSRINLITQVTGDHRSILADRPEPGCPGWTNTY